jgi:hypothetical protein
MSEKRKRGINMSGRGKQYLARTVTDHEFGNVVISVDDPAPKDILEQLKNPVINGDCENVYL